MHWSLHKCIKFGFYGTEEVFKSELRKYVCESLNANGWTKTLLFIQI